MPFADISNNKIHITTNYHERHLVKQIPGSRYNKDKEVWELPLSWAACITARGVFGDDLVISEKLVEWAWDQKNEYIEPAQQLRDALALPQMWAASGQTGLGNRR